MKRFIVEQTVTRETINRFEVRAETAGAAKRIVDEGKASPESSRESRLTVGAAQTIREERAVAR